jgi:hypothetical protein
MKKNIIASILAAITLFAVSCKQEAPYKALIVTGQGDHNWEISSSVYKNILDQTLLFDTYIAVSPEKGGKMEKFNPRFSDFNVVILDYNGDEWSEETKTAFVDYIKNGGGAIVTRPAVSAFPGWKEYNEICGLGTWKEGPFAELPFMAISRGRLIYDTVPALPGIEARRKETEVRFRSLEHPVTAGLPVRWLHGSDNIMGRLHGPADNLSLIATAPSDTTGKDEPVIWSLPYVAGRVFATTLGVTDNDGGPALKCAGFITLVQRGAEWAATGKVGQKVPIDFPSAAATVVRPEYLPLTLAEDLAGISVYTVGGSTKYLSDLQARIRDAKDDKAETDKIEKMMIAVLRNKKATADGKILILNELSWMGSDLSVTYIKECLEKEELKDAAKYALERMGVTYQ